VAVFGADAERGKVAQWRPAYLPPDPASRTAYAAGEIAGARDAGLPGISSFAKGLEQDLDAVTQGLTSRWNSGPVEGRVNHIKMHPATIHLAARTRAGTRPMLKPGEAG
jgi:hypothetical protein